MNAGRRLTAAREYLAGSRRRKISGQGREELAREVAELRRQLGTVLGVVGGADVWLSRDQARGVLSALDVAAEAKRDAADSCGDCDGSPDGELCGTCQWRLTVADEYDALAAAVLGQLDAGEAPPPIAARARALADEWQSAAPPDAGLLLLDWLPRTLAVLRQIGGAR